MTRCRPARLQVGRRVGEQHAVGRERQVAQPRPRGQRGDESRQIAAEQRLAAGEPEAIDAELRRTDRPACAISSNVSTSSRGSQRYSSSGMQ